MPYSPYGNTDDWFGVPGYGSYSNYLRSVSQPISLQGLTNMVQSLQQQSMPGGDYGTPYTPMVSPLPVSEMPAEIAQSIMDLRNRLLSTPRQRLAESADPTPTTPVPVPNQPAASTPAAGSPPVIRNIGEYGLYGQTSMGGGGGGPTPYTAPTGSPTGSPTYSAPAPSQTANPQWGYEPSPGINWGQYDQYR